jgi:hypothetical protein
MRIVRKEEREKNTPITICTTPSSSIFTPHINCSHPSCCVIVFSVSSQICFPSPSCRLKEGLMGRYAISVTGFDIIEVLKSFWKNKREGRKREEERGGVGKLRR